MSFTNSLNMFFSRKVFREKVLINLYVNVFFNVYTEV